MGTDSDCAQNKLHAHLFGEERVDVGFEDHCIDNSGMTDRDPILRVADNSEVIPPLTTEGVVIML